MAAAAPPAAAAVAATETPEAAPAKPLAPPKPSEPQPVAPAAQAPPAAEPSTRPSNPPILRPPTITPPRPAAVPQAPRPAGGPGEQPKRHRPVRKVEQVAPLVAPGRPHRESARAPVQPAAQKKYMELPDAVRRGEKAIGDINQLLKEANRGPAPVVAEVEVEDDDARKVRPGRVAGRGARHEKRVARAEERKGRSTDVKSLLEDDDGQVHVKLKKKKLHHQRPTEQRKEKAVLVTPITVRAFCEATGLRATDVGRGLEMAAGTGTRSRCRRPGRRWWPAPASGSRTG